ncbi:hypothetical protein [Frigoribacterium sp. CG_9.8]|uniref:hypothetical protein n=1 Tax=Frigoribacterium sp. CG_9.8 TaxID=2787733 RepID=UPI0018CB0D33|nr:hypothetical protein [Frigoribacterium sp. CG_9.8]
MTVGSRIVFMRFATARSPKLQLWIDHFERVAGNDGALVAPVVGAPDDGAYVWHLISANNRMLARGSRVHSALTGAIDDASRLQSVAREMQFRLVFDQYRGLYGWYASIEGIVALTCARWYVTERDRRSSIEHAELSLSVAVLRPGTRIVQPENSSSARSSIR